MTTTKAADNGRLLTKAGRRRCECEAPGCFHSGQPGIIAHVEPDGSLAHDAKIERCDQCRRYPTDAAARRALEARHRRRRPPRRSRQHFTTRHRLLNLELARALGQTLANWRQRPDMKPDARAQLERLKLHHRAIADYPVKRVVIVVTVPADFAPGDLAGWLDHVETQEPPMAHDDTVFLDDATVYDKVDELLRDLRAAGGDLAYTP
jgi:hypothetical protein